MPRTYPHPQPTERRSLVLTATQWAAIERIAAATRSLATTGTHTGRAAWRALVRRIADGDVIVSQKHDADHTTSVRTGV
jgi:hypothetical protein